MKKSEINKFETWAEKLKSVASRFPHQQRMMWAIENEMHLETVNRYLRGQVSSIPIAEKLFTDICAFLKKRRYGSLVA